MLQCKGVLSLQITQGFPLKLFSVSSGSRGFLRTPPGFDKQSSNSLTTNREEVEDLAQLTYPSVIFDTQHILQIRGGVVMRRGKRGIVVSSDRENRVM